VNVHLELSCLVERRVHESEEHLSHHVMLQGPLER
jgi:hypothetical protein